MTIRTRLALQFMLLASLVLGSAFVAVYMLSAAYRQEEFTGRMRDRGINAAKLLIQVDEVNEALLKKIERDNPVRLPEESIRIYDHHSELIFHLGDEGFPPTEVQLLNTVRLHGIVERRHGEREEVALPFNDRYDRFVVVVSGNDIFGRSKLRNLAKVLLVTFLIGVLLTFFVGRWYAQRALTPVQRLVLEMRRIGPGDLGHRVPVGSSQDEIAELARSFNELIARLADAFQAQRNFIANASHELRTPLTTEDMHALNRLADRLLLLAQAETGSTSTTFVPVRVDEVLWSARHEVQRSDPRYRVDVRITDVEEEKDVLVNGNEALLRSLMSNLMENACKYSDDQCAHVTMSGAGAALRIEVANTGPGIDPALHARIFEPFYRATNTGGAKGHGIGLSLARRIAELHRGRITLRSAIGQGASFAVVLPKAA